MIIGQLMISSVVLSYYLLLILLSKTVNRLYNKTVYVKINLSRTTRHRIALNKVSETVKLAGWVANKRDHATVTFLDLRDENGLVQSVGINDKLKDLTIESVVEVICQINKRPAKLVNQEMATGEIEVFVEDYQILNKSIEITD